MIFKDFFCIFKYYPHICSAKQTLLLVNTGELLRIQLINLVGFFYAHTKLFS